MNEAESATMKLTEFLADKKSHCPACGFRLGGRWGRRAGVVASGRCPRCNAPVIDDLPPLPEKSELEFASLRRRPPGIFNVHTFVTVLFGLAGYGTLWGLVTLSVWLSERASILVASVVSAVFSIGVALFLWEMFKKWRFRDWKPCLHCGKRMNPKFVLSTGRCHHCAVGLLAEADRSGTPVMTPEALERLRIRLEWRLVLAAALLVLAGTAVYHLLAAFDIPVPMWTMLALVFGSGGFRWLFDRWHRQPCPGCGADLVKWSTVAVTGNCRKCGQRILTPTENFKGLLALKRKFWLNWVASAASLVLGIFLWLWFGPWDCWSGPDDADLRPPPPIAVAPADNAWPYFEAAWKAMPPEQKNIFDYFCCSAHNVDYKWIGGKTEKKENAWEDAKVRDYLTLCQDALAGLDQGLACKVCQPPRETTQSKGLRCSYPFANNWPSFRCLTSALSLQAEYYRRHKQFDEAATHVRKLMRYGILLQSHPRDYEEFSRGIRCVAAGLCQLKGLAYDGDTPPMLLQSLERELRTYSNRTFWQPSLLQAEKGDYAWSADVIRDGTFFTMTTPFPDNSKNDFWLRCHFIYQPNRAQKRLASLYRWHFAELGRNLESAWILPYRKPVSPWNFPAPNFAGEGIALMMRPVPWGSARQRDKLATTITLTRLVLLCKAYEKQHGALPETLQTLVPDYLDAVPRDLWGDQPIRYVKARQLLYSVGPDGKDDGAVMDDHGYCSKDQVLELK